MIKLPGRRALGGILRSDNGKGPWGGEGGAGGGGPRNPWAYPPRGRQRTPGNPFDDFLRRARRGGPGGRGPDARSMVALGVAALLALWILFTSVHVVSPGQAGVVTVLGRYTGRLDPGVRLTAPLPFASVRTIDVTGVRTEVFPQNGGENLMLTQDQNIVNLGFSVNWYVSNPEDFAFQMVKPQDTVRAVAESAMRAVVATVSLKDAIGSGQGAIAARVQQNMQAILDGYNSGVQVQTVAIRQAGAPAEVDEAFKAVNAAQQEAQATINNSKGYAQRLIANAQGEAAEFDKIYDQYKLAPEVTKRRLYYETMEQVLAKSNKTIVEAPGVTPYLPLPGLRRTPRPDPRPDAGAAR